MISNSSHMILDQTSEEPNVNDIKIVGNVVESDTLAVSLLNSQTTINSKKNNSIDFCLFA